MHVLMPALMQHRQALTQSLKQALLQHTQALPRTLPWHAVTTRVAAKGPEIGPRPSRRGILLVEFRGWPNADVTQIIPGQCGIGLHESRRWTYAGRDRSLWGKPMERVTALYSEASALRELAERIDMLPIRDQLLDLAARYEQLAKSMEADLQDAWSHAGSIHLISVLTSRKMIGTSRLDWRLTSLS
jgi:hypothetical protein